MQTKIGLTRQEAQQISDFIPKDLSCIVFGSRVSGNWHKSSDLDICLKSEAPISMLVLGDLREKFELSELAFTVDIVDYHRCDQSFQTIIDNSGIELEQLLSQV